MRQIWISKVGDPRVLQLRKAPDPLPGPGRVRIRVHASGVNFADIMARLGLYPDAPKLPAVVGYEVSGVVDATGADIKEPKEGQRVLALTNFGGYSDVVVVPARQTFLIPDSLCFKKAAAIPVNYLTAWIMLVHLGNLQANEKVLVHAVAGGVGQAAFQICRWRGATVIGTASLSKHERLKQMGMVHCIDSQAKNFERQVMEMTNGLGVDIALDPIGGSSFAKSYACLAPLGRMYMYGVSSLAPRKARNIPAAIWGLWRMSSFRPIRLMNHNRSVTGINLGHLWQQSEKLSIMLDRILERVSGGDFDPVVDKTFKLEQAALAHSYIQERRNFGKVLLVP